jgi:hypothetical protein
MGIEVVRDHNSMRGTWTFNLKKVTLCCDSTGKFSGIQCKI